MVIRIQVASGQRAGKDGEQDLIFEIGDANAVRIDGGCIGGAIERAIGRGLDGTQFVEDIGIGNGFKEAAENGVKILANKAYAFDALVERGGVGRAGDGVNGEEMVREEINDFDGVADDLAVENVGGTGGIGEADDEV